MPIRILKYPKSVTMQAHYPPLGTYCLSGVERAIPSIVQGLRQAQGIFLPPCHAYFLSSPLETVLISTTHSSSGLFDEPVHQIF